MKKKLLVLFVLLIGVFLVGCSRTGEKTTTAKSETTENQTEKGKDTEQAENKEKKKIVLGSIPILNEVCEEAVPLLKEKGYDLEVKLVTDSMQLIQALEDGSVDASFHMHEIIMKKMNESKGMHIAKVGDKLYDQVVGLYSNKITNKDEIPNGAKVGIQNDAINRDRALKLISDAGLIKLADAGSEDGLYGLADIVENPHNLEFVELEGRAMVETSKDFDLMVMSGLNSAKAGFFADKALATYDREDADKYAICLTTKQGNENSDFAKTIYEALQSEEVQAKMSELTHGTLKPLFK